jgi:hypothetical protein
VWLRARRTVRNWVHPSNTPSAEATVKAKRMHRIRNFACDSFDELSGLELCRTVSGPFLATATARTKATSHPHDE